MLKCKSCGKEVESSIEFDDTNFDIYCPECGKKQVNIEIQELYPKPKRTELDIEEVRKLWWSGEGMIKNPIKEDKE